MKNEDIASTRESTLKAPYTIVRASVRNFGQKMLLTAMILSFSLTAISQEVCNNGVDDDGDGLIDCADGDCATDYVSCPAFQSSNLSCPPGGIYADIIGTNSGFKADNGTTGPISMIFPAGTETIRLVIQGNYEDFDFIGDPAAGGTGSLDLEHADDRLIYGIVEIDLATGTSSGSVEYLSNMVLSSRYVWDDQPLSPANTSTYVRDGHNVIDLPDFEFVFNTVGSALEVTCLQGDINISYFTTFYGNSALESMTRVDGIVPSQYPAYFAAGSISQIIDLPASGADFVTITTLAVNQNRTGNFGTLVTSQKEEGNARKEILLDLTNNLASGIITVGNGSIDDYCSTYSFENYDLTTGLDVLSSGAIILGETSANTTTPEQIGMANPTLQIVGGQLIITRSAAFANDFNEIYYVKFYKRTGLPWSSGFKEVSRAYVSPADIGYNSTGSVIFPIPEGTRYTTIFASGNGLYGGSLDLGIGTLTAGQIGNENQVISYAEIDILTNTHEGYNVMLATANDQQMYAWTGLNVNPAIDFAVVGPTVGQLPSTNDRINFDVSGGNLEVFFTNHTWAMERVVLVTFVGQYPDVLGDTIIQEFPPTGDCDSLYFSTVTCNGGSQNLNGMLPYSIYTSDPTIDPSSILLLVDSIYLDWPIGQCDTISFALATTYLPPNSGDVHIVFNDDGTFGTGVGNPIGTSLQLGDLSNGLSYMAECDENNNLLAGQYTYTPLPPANLGNDTSFCGIFSLDLNPILDSSYTYTWQDASTDTLFTATTNGTYWVDIVDYRNCTETDTLFISNSLVTVNLGNDSTICQGETVQLDATLPGATYVWQDASGLAQLTATTTGQYWVEVDQNGCLGSDTINISVTPLPLVNLGPDTTICFGEDIILDATDPGASYEWYDNSTNPTNTVTTTGTYWVEVTLNNCINSDTTSVIVTPLPAIDLGADVSFCDGVSMTFDISVPGGTYLWHDGSISPALTASTTGTYFAIVTADNCSNGDTINITVNPIPTIDLGPDISLCPGENIQLDATTPAATYMWQNGTTLPTLNVSSSGSYSVGITVNGCSSSDTLEAVINPVPIFSLGNITSICEEEIALGTSTSFTSYLWQDGSTSNTFLVYEPGDYSLTVSNSFGCYGTENISIVNGCEPNIWIPNVFTPDGDMYNEEFYATGTYLEDFEMTIFNRWGNVVKELHSIEETWDGTTMNGSMVNDGVYIWLVHYSYLLNDTLIKKKITGHVTVVR